MKLETVFALSTRKLLDFLQKWLSRRDYPLRVDQEYVYGQGELPVLLVAHVDTWHRLPPDDIFFDQKQQVYWSPDGLGADDRAGVWAILRILERGYRPHVLFLDGEERGGTGACAAVDTLPVPDVHYIVELDRRGRDDAVFYDCDNPEFTAYVGSFGFKKASGSFSDISWLCPVWGVAGVNLSVGYYNQHSRNEYLRLNETRRTIDRVRGMLKVAPTSKRYEYVERSGGTRRYSWYTRYEEYEEFGDGAYCNHDVPGGLCDGYYLWTGEKDKEGRPMCWAPKCVSLVLEGGCDTCRYNQACRTKDGTYPRKREECKWYEPIVL